MAPPVICGLDGCLQKSDLGLEECLFVMVVPGLANGLRRPRCHAAGGVLRFLFVRSCKNPYDGFQVYLCPSGAAMLGMARVRVCRERVNGTVAKMNRELKIGSVALRTSLFRDRWPCRETDIFAFHSFFLILFSIPQSISNQIPLFTSSPLSPPSTRFVQPSSIPSTLSSRPDSVFSLSL
jgi:hypothetical protein